MAKREAKSTRDWPIYLYVPNLIQYQGCSHHRGLVMFLLAQGDTSSAAGVVQVWSRWWCRTE